MHDVFLSYTQRDSNAASLLAEQLRAAGISVFWDRDLLPGEPFLEAISTAVGQARVYVLLHPGQSGSSDMLERETQAAIARSASEGLPLLPVLLPGREPVGDIGRFRYIRVASEIDFAPVVEIVGKTLHRSSQSGQSPSGQQLSFLSSLLHTDMARAPQAAAVVLDEIAQTVGGSTDALGRDLEVLREAAKWGQVHLGPEHPSVTSLAYHLAEALLSAGLYDESLLLSEQAVKMSIDLEDKVKATLNLAHALVESGRLDEARGRYMESLRLAQTTDSEPAIATSLVGLGTVARMQGDRTDALGFFTQAVRATSRPWAMPNTRLKALIELCELTTGTGDPELRRRYATEVLWLARTTAPDADLARRAEALVRAEGGEK